jgi:phage shock protein A
MPTKADYDRLADKVNAINKNLNEIDLRIDGLIKKIESLTARPAAAKPVAAKGGKKK